MVSWPEPQYEETLRGDGGASSETEISGTFQNEAGNFSSKAVAPAPMPALYYGMMYGVWNYTDPHSTKQAQSALLSIQYSYGHMTEVTEMFFC